MLIKDQIKMLQDQIKMIQDQIKMLQDYQASNFVTKLPKLNYKITYQMFGSPEVYTKLFENVPYEFIENVSFFKLEKI